MVALRDGHYISLRSPVENRTIPETCQKQWFIFGQKLGGAGKSVSGRSASLQSRRTPSVSSRISSDITSAQDDRADVTPAVPSVLAFVVGCRTWVSLCFVLGCGSMSIRMFGSILCVVSCLVPWILVLGLLSTISGKVGGRGSFSVGWGVGVGKAWVAPSSWFVCWGLSWIFVRCSGCGCKSWGYTCSPGLLFVCGVVGRLGSGITSVGPRRPPSAPCRPLRLLARFGWVTKDTSRLTDQVTQVRNWLVHCQSCIWSSLRVCCLFCGWQQLQSLQNAFLFCMFCVF